jgi:hypothetical protein
MTRRLIGLARNQTNLKIFACLIMKIMHPRRKHSDSVVGFDAIGKNH